MSDYNLTKREKEVFEYLCRGYNNLQIAKILSISKHTSKAHVSSILKKLGVKSRTLAAYIAGQDSLIQIDRNTLNDMSDIA